jgi:hypothetical protein
MPQGIPHEEIINSQLRNTPLRRGFLLIGRRNGPHFDPDAIAGGGFLSAVLRIDRIWMGEG